MASEHILARQRVEWGKWTDHRANETKLLLTDDHAVLLTAFVATWLALAWTHIFRLVKHVVLLLRPRGEDGDEQQPLLPADDSAPPTVMETIEKAGGGRELLVETWHQVSKVGARHRTGLLLFDVLVLGVFVVWVVLDIVFAARLSSDTAALWKSDRCGVWKFDADRAGEGAATRADVRDRGREARAGTYAKRCYDQPAGGGDDSSLPPMGCGFFCQPAIAFTNSTSYACPFGEPNICAPESPSITFDTGLVDARQIGVNDGSPYRFRRTATCAPLNTGEPFVRSEVEKGTKTFYYHYGELADGARRTNHTFSSVGNPFDVLEPAYKVSAYATSWFPQYDYWRPIPELVPPENSTVTILFISSLHIFYLDYSSDPIFGAGEKYQFDGESRPWWYKSDPKFGVLACIDSHQLCSPDGESCWSMTDQGKGQSHEYWLMKLSLESSNMYDAIAHRLGLALLAQERVSQYTSAGLGEDHWKLEAAQLFATSLARIQFDAWSIASGEDSQLEGYVDLTPADAGNLCGLFQFTSTGYRNLNVKALILLLLTLPAVLVLSLPVKDKWFWATEYNKKDDLPLLFLIVYSVWPYNLYYVFRKVWPAVKNACTNCPL